jgi:sugar O-acyltransferase (sialic acid O-acetyltransferase NeuD family)
MKKLVIFGCGEIAELVHFYFTSDTNYEVVGFTVDQDYMPDDQTFCGLPVAAFETVDHQFPPRDCELFVALSYTKVNKLRAAKFEAAKAKGFTLASYISSHATVLTRGPIGENSLILEDNTIQPFVRIGRNVTLWSGNHIGHHSTIGDHCFIASHVVVSGGVNVGEYSFIGVNATLRNGVSIGGGCVIGMGANIQSNCEPNGVYPGVGSERAKIPANKLRNI